MTKRMLIMLIATTVVFGSIFGMKWFGNKMMNQYVDNMPTPPATITTAQAAPMTWANELEATGSFVPVNGTNVTTEAGGIVTAIHFESGSRVTQGTRLITLDSANENADLKRLQAQADLAEINRSRQEKLLGLEAVSKADYDNAVSQAKAAKAAVDAQRARVALKEIRAPFAGVLGIRQINLGQYLAPGTAIVTLQSLDPIQFDFNLPEQLAPLVTQGLKISVKVDAYPDADFTGVIAAIEPQIDAATRNFRLRALLPNVDLMLKPGQFGRVVITLPGEQTVLAAPRTAISYSSYGTSVFVVQKRPKPENPPEKMPGMPEDAELEVVQRFVRTGAARGDFVAVVEGLKEGEQIATSGLLKLRNHQPIVINNDVRPDVQLAPKPDNT